MQQCAQPRADQQGTWITDDIVASYVGLHRRGVAVSIEVCYDNELVGGLYGVSLGKMFYGESMFSRRADASKIALAVLVNTLDSLGFHMVDCQQNTRHLASMGASEIDRAQFIATLSALVAQSGPDWSVVELTWPNDRAGVVPVPR
jgi:leucyl/phenylalanyl-tRNA---protein transferase